MRRAPIATGAVVEPLVIDPGSPVTCRDDRGGPSLPDVLGVHRVPGPRAGGWTAPALRRVRAARAARTAPARPVHARDVSVPAPCTVWWADPVDPQDAPDLVHVLDAHERDRLTRLRRATDRARYLAAHTLTRLVLGELLDVPAAAVDIDRTCHCGGRHGKPVLRDVTGPGFSLTHAGDLVGLAVWPDGPVGLDVEPVRALTDLPGMARHVGSPTESARDGTVTAEAFFALWTRKEALLKATGTGLAAPMTAITLDGTTVTDWTGEHAPTERMWLRDLHPAPGYAAAVAGPGPSAPPLARADGDALLRARCRYAGG